MSLPDSRSQRTWPLRDALRGGLGSWDPPSIGLGLALAALWLGTLAAAAAPETWIRRSHHEPGALWALTQPLPFMYTHENRWSVVRQGTDPQEVADWCAGITEGWRQHGPLAAMTAPTARPRFAECGLPAEVTVETRLREHVVRSRFRLTRQGDAVQIEALP